MKEHVAFWVCFVTTAYTVAGFFILRESWRAGMFSHARAAIATAYKCWRGRRENPVLMYGPRKIFSTTGALVVLIVLVNVEGLWALMSNLRSGLSSGALSPQSLRFMVVVNTNARWVWASIAISAALFCYVVDRWKERPDFLNPTLLIREEIIFGRFYRAYLLTISLSLLETAGLLAILRSFGEGATPWSEVVRVSSSLVSSNLPVAIVSPFIAIQLRLAGRSFFTTAVGTLVFTYVFTLVTGTARDVSWGIPSFGLEGFGDDRVDLFLGFLTSVRYGAILAGVTLAFLTLAIRDWDASRRPRLKSVGRRIVAAARSAGSRQTCLKTLQFGGLAFLSYQVIGVPISWILAFLGGGSRTPRFLETPWECFRSYVVAGVILVWYARRKCANAGPREEEPQLARVALAFVGMVLLTVLYRAALAIGVVDLYYAKTVVFISALAVLPMLHVAGSPRPRLALAGWLLAAPWYEIMKPTLQYHPWELIGDIVGHVYWVPVLVIAYILSRRIADRWADAERRTLEHVPTQTPPAADDVLEWDVEG